MTWALLTAIIQLLLELIKLSKVLAEKYSAHQVTMFVSSLSSAMTGVTDAKTDEERLKAASRLAAVIGTIGR
jgi:hypothetical protein